MGEEVLAFKNGAHTGVAPTAHEFALVMGWLPRTEPRRLSRMLPPAARAVPVLPVLRFWLRALRVLHELTPKRSSAAAARV